MTKLPITSNNLPSPANNAQGGALQLRNDLSSVNEDASTSQGNSVSNNQVAELFSALLARQIDDAGAPVRHTDQISSALDAKAKTSNVKDVKYQSDVSDSTASDQMNSLNTMLLNIPVQQTNTHSDKENNNNLIMTRANGVKQGIVKSLQQKSVTATGTDNAIPTINNKIQADSTALRHLSTDVAQHSDMVISPTNQPLPSHSITKDIASSSASTAISNIPSSITHIDTPQSMTTPIGNNGWADEFSQKIVWMSNQQNQVAELHLNPPDLGPLNVLLKISDNQLTAQFTSPHSAVRDAVENALPKLREILADNNITLGNATVSDQAPRDRGADGFMNQGSGTAAHHESSFSSQETNRQLPSNTQSMPARRHNGILDIFA